MSSGSPKVALVTGASRGIGLAIAQALSQAGYAVALTARSQVQLEKNLASLQSDFPNMAIAADLLDPLAPQQILSKVQQTLGEPSVLVNNAGTAPTNKMENSSDAELEQVLDLHLKAPFRLIRALLPGMRKRGKGCLLQLASSAGLRGFPYTAAYTSAKHAMVGLTRALATEIAGTDIKAYAVCPGFVDTDITRKAATDIAARGKQTAAQALAKMGEMNNIGRLHSADEVAQAVLHLVQEQPEGCVWDLDRDPPAFV